LITGATGIPLATTLGRGKSTTSQNGFHGSGRAAGARQEAGPRRRDVVLGDRGRNQDGPDMRRAELCGTAGRIAMLVKKELHD